MKRHFTLLLFTSFLYSSLCPQVNFTANDQVIPFDGPFRYGANLNYYPPWNDTQVADIAVGTSSLPGIGINVIRGSLTEEFLETWGYHIRVDYYQHYQSLGANDHLVIVGYPGGAHKETGSFCTNTTSELFANLYEPIWDNGNGTPYNEANYFAAYMYQMVSQYKDFVKFWEIWNEPDFTWNTGIAYAPPGAPGNWWDNEPDPCDMAIQAPIYHYIRMLRVAWEVVKTVDPDAYVATGGLGNPAFLDAVLRNTDNPNGGDTNNDFPLMGGAYFDVLSYHSYPHFDGSLREFNGTGWTYHRHSDRAAEGLIARKDLFQEVLESHGYDGSNYPNKLWLVSETNLPRKSFFAEYLGSNEAQRNFAIKALVQAQVHGLEQVYFYIISDNKPADQAAYEFETMGLFKNLSQYNYPNYEVNDEAIAIKTTFGFLNNREYQKELTESLELPSHVGGAAFTNNEDSVIVIWAKTNLDNSEVANATYNLPDGFEFTDGKYANWDFSANNFLSIVSPNSIDLTGAPVFAKINKKREIIENTINGITGLTLNYFPNPTNGQLFLEISNDRYFVGNIKLFNQYGTLIKNISNIQGFNSGNYLIKIELPERLNTGVYFLKIEAENGSSNYLKIIIVK